MRSNERVYGLLQNGGINQYMESKCENCRYFHMLKHNFEVGKGYEISSCCIALTRVCENPSMYEAFVVEVDKDSECELFEESSATS